MIDFTKRNLFIGLVFVIVVIVFSNLPSLTSDNEIVAWYKKMDYDGIVERKFEDPENHYSRTFVVKDSSGNKQTLVDNFDASGFYDFVKIGDRVSKDLNSMSTRVSRNELDTVFTISFEF